MFNLITVQNSLTVDLFLVVFTFHFLNSERRLPSFTTSELQ